MKRFLVKADLLVELEDNADTPDAFDYVDELFTTAQSQPEKILLSSVIREVIVSSRRTLNGN